MPSNFTAQWKNRLDQLGITTLDVEIVHDEGVIPSRWIHKSYRMEPKDVDENFLQAEAEKEITRMVDEWNAEQERIAAELAAQQEEQL